MSQNHDTMDLHDDAFEGSNDEIRISQEVFYGNADYLCSERGPAAGTTKAANEGNKMVKISLCTNSENSAVTNQDSLKDLCLKDAEVMDFQSDFSAQTSTEWSIVGARIEHDLHAKRMKLSVNELSNFKPYLDTAAASSVPVKQFVSGMYDPTLHACCQILMCHVVESTGEGVRSSCYLLKHILGSDREDNSGDGRIPDVSLSGSDGIMVKQSGGGKSIASPISQESSATKLLVSTPAVVMINKPGSKRVERRHKRNISPEPEDDDVLLTSDSMNDSRALLRSRVFHLLKRVGWSTEKRDRGCGRYRYVYRSPEGKFFRELRRVWSLFGQSVFGNCNQQVVGEDKHWSDVGHFWSDLYDTLRYIENEMDELEPKHALVRQWVLLNPFVTVVLIDRKIHTLGTGNLDKVECRDGVDVGCKAKAKFRSKSTKNNYKRSVNKCMGEMVHDSSLASDSAFIDGGLKPQEALEAYKSCSIYFSEGNSLRLVRTIDRIKNRSVDTCTEEIMHNPSSLPGCVSESTSFLQINDSSSQSKFEMQAWSMDNAESDERSNNNSIQSQYLGKITRPQKREVGRKRSMACQIKDDDLLISAIIKKRSFKSSMKQRREESEKFELKPLKKRKSQKGGCRLLPRSLGKGNKHFKDRWSLMSERTVLSWLISSGAGFLNEAIQFRDPKDDSVVKDGHITRHGILCKCCNDVFSVSGFKIHAGFKQSRPCLNFFMGSGKPYTLCQLQAWSAEYKARKSITRSTPTDEFDENDDSCGLCGDGGELLCCDNCPSTFHQSCLSEEKLPEGSWYCSNCICQICGGLVNDKETSVSDVGLKCLQCSQKYHQVCLIDKTVLRVSGSPWFCGIDCEEVYEGLQSRVGLCIPIADGYSWILLRCIHDDQKSPSPQHFALKAECNSKLAVAITIMEECFLSMSDPRTGINMIPQVVYNWGSEFPRLDYHGFYTVVLEMDDVLVSVACIRVHGVALAEMPLIATCSKHRRQGMCRRLLDAIEKMLTSLKVEKLVIAAIPELVETWTVGFDFVIMEEDEKRSLRKVNLMVFPGTVMLKKTLCVNLPTDVQQGVKVVSPMDNDESFEMELCLDVELNAKATIVQKSSEVAPKMESQPLNTLGSSKLNDKDTNVMSTCSHIQVNMEKESERTCTFVPDGCVDWHITSSASEVKVDNGLTLQVIEDQDNGLHVGEDSKIVEAANEPEVQSSSHNPLGKSKAIIGDKPGRIDQDSPFSSLLSKSSLEGQLTQCLDIENQLSLGELSEEATFLSQS